MKYILITLLLSITLSVIGNRPSQGIYTFHDPISLIAPIWTKTNSNKLPFLSSSYHIKKSKYFTSLEYYNAAGYLYKSESWLENRKKKSAVLLSSMEFVIKFDSLQGVQVETGKSDTEYYYDSLKFSPDGTLEYRYIYSTYKSKESEWDTSISRCKLIFKSEELKKYEVGRLGEEPAIYTYINNRPISVKHLNYSDSIVYLDYTDYTIINYYFKGSNDTKYFIGEKDSVSNELVHSKRFFEKYYPNVSLYENYFFDNKKRLVLKTYNGGYEVYIYSNNGIEKYVSDAHSTQKTTILNLGQFPFVDWKITTTNKQKNPR